jgi:hypothetical protein
MTFDDLTEDERREFAEYEASLARPIRSLADITDDLIHVLAETGLANRVLNKLRTPLRPRSITVKSSRPDLQLEEDYGIGGLDDFEDRQRQLKATLGALLERGRAKVSLVVKILRCAKDDATNLSVDRLISNPRLIRARLALRRDFEKCAKKALAFVGKPAKDMRESPWVPVYNGVLDAVKFDPLLNPQAPKRSRGQTRHQELLKETSAKLRKARVSAADVKTLLEATGLIELLKAKRLAPPSRRK